MSKYLCQTTEVYRVNSESEAAKLIEDAKADNRFVVLKSSTEYKPVKVKGIVEDEYWKTTLVKQFTDIKDPDATVSVEYKVENGYFPQVDSIEKESSTEVEF